MSLRERAEELDVLLRAERIYGRLKCGGARAFVKVCNVWQECEDHPGGGFFTDETYEAIVAQAYSYTKPESIESRTYAGEVTIFEQLLERSPGWEVLVPMFVGQLQCEHDRQRVELEGEYVDALEDAAKSGSK